MKPGPVVNDALSRWQRKSGLDPAQLDDVGKQRLVQELAQDPALDGLSKIDIVRALEASAFEVRPFTLEQLAGGRAAASSAERTKDVSGNTVLGARLGTAEVSAGPVELTLRNTLDFAASFQAGVLVVGFGSKNQFKDPDAVRGQVDQIVARNNEKYGEGKWFATFGGDPLNEEKPDIAIVAKRLIDLGVPTLAVQSDVVRDEWGGVDKHIPVVHYAPTDRDGEGNIQWGGKNDAGELLGPSKVYLGPLAEHLTELALFGGGDIAEQEVGEARQLGLSIIDCPAEARNPTGPPLGASEALFPDHAAGRVYFDS